VNRAILGDLHIGDGRVEVARIRSAIAVLQTQTLILNGDVLDLLYSDGELTREMEDFLAFLSTLPMEIIWILGNHDASVPRDAIPSNVTVLQMRYVFRVGTKRYCVTHGHQVDWFLQDHPRLSRWAIRLYAFAFRYLGLDLQSWVRRFAFAQRDLAHQEQECRARWGYMYDFLITGHTHRPSLDEENRYANSGDWIAHGTIVYVDEAGVRLKEAP